MKYKIGELEIEAVQWNDTDPSFDRIYNLASKCGGGIDIERINLGGYEGFQLRVEVSEAKAFLSVGGYLVKSEESLFTLSEQDFNKIATKVKEPKFKVGDKVYVEPSRCSWIEVHKVTDISYDDQPGFVYQLDEDYRYSEKYVLTLEEAIEKLKEL